LKGGWLQATLAEKIPEQTIRRGLEPLRQFLAKESHGLRVEWEYTTRRGWLQIAARGDDAEAFLNLLKQKFAIVPEEGSKVEKWDLLRGFVTGSGRIGFGVYMDIGVLEPIAKDGLYPLYSMRAQLADREIKSCREILVENGLVDDFPVLALVTGVEGEKISLELSDRTRELLWSWRKFPFDRVLASGVTTEEAERVVRSAGLQFDVIRVQPLSLFFQCLVCKMGTDAPGVIARIGPRLEAVRLAAYRTHFKAF
jgi:hypothetical protein